MADELEDVDLVEPTLQAPATGAAATQREQVTQTIDELRSVSKAHYRRAREHANASPSAEEKGPVQRDLLIPPLPRRQVGGYTRGVATTIYVVSVGAGKHSELEENAALDFLLMRRAARLAGVALDLVVGLRSHEEQTRLYLERESNPVLKVTLGPAAKPGWSKHESGRAADISVGLSIKQYAEGQRTAAFNWLQANGKTYGWDWVGGRINPIEPWHYEHNDDKVVGPINPSDVPALVSTDASSRNAADVNRLVLASLHARELHDILSGARRADDMAKTSRKRFIDAAAADAVLRAAKADQTRGSATASAQALEDVPPGFTEAAIKSLSYDFSTGLWGDGKPV